MNQVTSELELSDFQQNKSRLADTHDTYVRISDCYALFMVILKLS